MLPTAYVISLLDSPSQIQVENNLINYQSTGTDCSINN